MSAKEMRLLLYLPNRSLYSPATTRGPVPWPHSELLPQPWLPNFGTCYLLNVTILLLCSHKTLQWFLIFFNVKQFYVPLFPLHMLCYVITLFYWHEIQVYILVTSLIFFSSPGILCSLLHYLFRSSPHLEIHRKLCLKAFIYVQVLQISPALFNRT